MPLGNKRFLLAQRFGLLIALGLKNDHAGNSRIPLERAAKLNFPFGIQFSQILYMPCSVMFSFVSSLTIQI